MAAAVVFAQGLLELSGLAGFLIGYFGGVWWLMVLGGCLIVLDDIIEILMGILNPLFPIALVIVLAIFLNPWYVGVFWASAAFKVLGIPTALRKLFTPKRFTARASQRTSG
jgi:hypothetical protein